MINEQSIILRNYVHRDANVGRMSSQFLVLPIRVALEVCGIPNFPMAFPWQRFRCRHKFFCAQGGASVEASQVICRKRTEYSPSQVGVLEVPLSGAFKKRWSPVDNNRSCYTKTMIALRVAPHKAVRNRLPPASNSGRIPHASVDTLLMGGYFDLSMLNVKMTGQDRRHIS